MNDKELYISCFTDGIDEFATMHDVTDSLDLDPLISPPASPSHRVRSLTSPSPLGSPERPSSPTMLSSEVISKSLDKKNHNGKRPLVIDKLPFNMQPKKQKTEEDKLNDHELMKRFVNQCTQNNIFYTNELMIMLEACMSRLRDESIIRGVDLFFHYELFALTYFLIHDLGELIISNYQFNLFKRNKSDESFLLSGVPLAQKWDVIMNGFEENLRETLTSIFIKNQNNNTLPFSQRLTALFAYVQKSFGLFNVISKKKKPLKKDSLTCSVTGRNLEQDEEFNVFQMAMCQDGREQETAEIVSFFPVTLATRSGVENVLIKFIVALISFFGYRAVLGKQLTIWRDKQKFSNAESLQVKIQTFKESKVFVFELLYDFALYYNHFITFIKIMNRFR